MTIHINAFSYTDQECSKAFPAFLGIKGNFTFRNKVDPPSKGAPHRAEFLRQVERQQSGSIPGLFPGLWLKVGAVLEPRVSMASAMGLSLFSHP